jgi:ABC-type glycerol-3-phosphate transport system permease component
MVILPTLNEIDSARSVPWELVLAGCTLVTIPLIVVFLLFQDKFLSSVTLGAVKG